MFHRLLALALCVSTLGACAETRPQVRSAPADAPDAGMLARPEPIASPDGGAPDSGLVEDAASPAPIAFIDVGPVPGSIQPCPRDARFTSLSAFLGKPASGRIQLRGSVWLPAAYPCTAGLPEACFAAPVLALRRPDEREQQVLALVGALGPNQTLTCVGRHQDLSCPIPVDGAEYGVVGVAMFSYAGATLTVESLCRFGTETRR